ncbi:MAG: hypothetical protein ABI760_24000, partial [Ferruginibacter sp.]
VTTDTLKFATPPSNYAAYHYRCLVTSAGMQDSSLAQQLHFKNEWVGSISTQWTNSANWSCGKMPDRFTDIIIKTGALSYPIISSDVQCRSIYLQKAATVTVNSGYTIRINQSPE